MKELIKAIFEKKVEFAKYFIRAMNDPDDDFSAVYQHFKKLTDMPYDCKLKFPYEVIDSIRREWKPRPVWLITYDSTKTQKKYMVVDPIYNYPADSEIIGFLLKKHGFNIKPLIPFPEEYGLDWLQRNDGLAKARDTALKYAYDDQGVLISQSDYKWWSMMKFKAKYAPQIRQELDKLNIKYELVLS